MSTPVEKDLAFLKELLEVHKMATEHQMARAEMVKAITPGWAHSPPINVEERDLQQKRKNAANVDNYVKSILKIFIKLGSRLHLRRNHLSREPFDPRKPTTEFIQLLENVQETIIEHVDQAIAVVKRFSDKIVCNEFAEHSEEVESVLTRLKLDIISATLNKRLGKHLDAGTGEHRPSFLTPDEYFHDVELTVKERMETVKIELSDLKYFFAVKEPENQKREDIPKLAMQSATSTPALRNFNSVLPNMANSELFPELDVPEGRKRKRSSSLCASNFLETHVDGSSSIKNVTDSVRVDHKDKPTGSKRSH